MLEYSVLYPVNTVSRQVLSLDGMWRFKIDWDSAMKRGRMFKEYEEKSCEDGHCRIGRTNTAD